eukprot:ANDGO_07914.mRNA.1 hypothetical protein
MQPNISFSQLIKAHSLDTTAHAASFLDRSVIGSADIASSAFSKSNVQDIRYPLSVQTFLHGKRDVSLICTSSPDRSLVALCAFDSFTNGISATRVFVMRQESMSAENLVLKSEFSLQVFKPSSSLMAVVNSGAVFVADSSSSVIYRCSTNASGESVVSSHDIETGICSLAALPSESELEHDRLVCLFASGSVVVADVESVRPQAKFRIGDFSDADDGDSEPDQRETSMSRSFLQTFASFFRNPPSTAAKRRRIRYFADESQKLLLRCWNNAICIATASEAFLFHWHPTSGDVELVGSANVAEVCKAALTCLPDNASVRIESLCYCADRNCLVVLASYSKTDFLFCVLELADFGVTRLNFAQEFPPVFSTDLVLDLFWDPKSSVLFLSCDRGFSVVWGQSVFDDTDSEFAALGYVSADSVACCPYGSTGILAVSWSNIVVFHPSGSNTDSSSSFGSHKGRGVSSSEPRGSLMDVFLQWERGAKFEADHISSVYPRQEVMQQIRSCVFSILDEEFLNKKESSALILHRENPRFVNSILIRRTRLLSSFLTFVGSCLSVKQLDQDLMHAISSLVACVSFRQWLFSDASEYRARSNMCLESAALSFPEIADTVDDLWILDRVSCFHEIIANGFRLVKTICDKGPQSAEDFRRLHGLVDFVVQCTVFSPSIEVAEIAHLMQSDLVSSGLESVFDSVLMPQILSATVSLCNHHRLFRGGDIVLLTSLWRLMLHLATNGCLSKEAFLSESAAFTGYLRSSPSNEQDVISVALCCGCYQFVLDSASPDTLSSSVDANNDFAAFFFDAKIRENDFSAVLDTNVSFHESSIRRALSAAGNERFAWALDLHLGNVDAAFTEISSFLADTNSEESVFLAAVHALLAPPSTELLPVVKLLLS